jgi:hypothetical protein
VFHLRLHVVPRTENDAPDLTAALLCFTIQPMKIQFSIRDILLMTVIAAISVGWWLDHRSLVNRYKSTNSSNQLVMVYPITSADPNVVLKVLQTTLTGEPFRLTVDTKSNFIVALATPSQHETIREVVDKMEGK